VVAAEGLADLAEVVLAIQACGGLPYLVDGGEKQPQRDRNDGNHHQQLHQRECRSVAPASTKHRTLPSERKTVASQTNDKIMRTMQGLPVSCPRKKEILARGGQVAGHPSPMLSV